MRSPILSAAFAALCFALPTAAQKLQAFSQSSARNESRMILISDDRKTFAWCAINHGQPEWQDKYDGMMDSLKGKMNRLGKDFWTTLGTTSELEIGGTKIAPGMYAVGLHCDKDGKFSLALIDAGKAIKDGIRFDGDWKPEFSVPLTLNKDAAAESVSKMTLTLKADEGGGGKGTFTLAWGKHTLTAPVQLHAPAPAAKK